MKTKKALKYKLTIIQSPITLMFIIQNIIQAKYELSGASQINRSGAARRPAGKHFASIKIRTLRIKKEAAASLLYVHDARRIQLSHIQELYNYNSKIIIIKNKIEKASTYSILLFMLFVYLSNGICSWTRINNTFGNALKPSQITDFFIFVCFKLITNVPWNQTLVIDKIHS